MNTTNEPGARRGRLLSSAISFAHLAGITPIVPAAAAAERQEPRLTAPARVEDDKKDADPDRHPDGKFRAKKKEGEGEDGENEEGENEEDEEGDDDSDGKEAAETAERSVRAARLRERARCAAIFGAKEAARNPMLAAHLAFETSLTRSQAIATLTHGAKGVGGLASRMAAQPTNGVPAGNERPVDRKRQVNASWDRSFQKFGR